MPMWKIMISSEAKHEEQLSGKNVIDCILWGIKGSGGGVTNFSLH